MRRYKSPKKKVSFTIFRILHKNRPPVIGKTETRKFEEECNKYLMSGFEIEAIKEVTEEI
jgi:hypothetical protein